jgi:hypothetical protein
MLHKSEADAYARQWEKRHGPCVAVEEPFILPAVDDVLAALDDFHDGPLALAFYECVSDDQSGPFRRVSPQFAPDDFHEAMEMVSEFNLDVSEDREITSLIGIFPRELTADESEVADA